MIPYDPSRGLLRREMRSKDRTVMFNKTKIRLLEFLFGNGAVLGPAR